MVRLPDPAVRQRWSRLIQLHEQSDLAISDFCDLHEVSTASFYRWRQRLQDDADQSDAFLAVQIEQPRPQIGGTTVRFPCGTQIELASCDANSLMIIVDRLAPQPSELQQ
ncbi:transposase [Stieleria sp. ICT_E10.1]|uniref:IS66 family insertion sequence element accessory protein TnpA n=1 Tax=Stieleria sedimenti TaxID=2976331 RepID=UPI00217F9759|nr:transposase [Stieleria sedimenti]MCS7468524.1 transposase [Stieleria sedimenti]